MRLIVTDIDNTLFDWVEYYTEAFLALLEAVGKIVDVDPAILATQAQKVFTEHRSIEYPFLIQELPSVIAFYGDDIVGFKFCFCMIQKRKGHTSIVTSCCCCLIGLLEGLIVCWRFV